VENAPGAEDNGVGAAALLEIARVLRYYQFDATIKLIWFTGEEQGLQGSQAYLLDYGMFSEDLVGVINLDMFGYDSNGDDCFEIHAGTLPESHALGDCLVNSIAAYSLPLTYDYIKAEIGSANSDHLPFWANGFGAIEILENHFNRQTMDDYQQCGEDADVNPYYHSMNDTISNSIDIPVAFNLVKASLATAASVAEPQGACFESHPVLTLHSSIPNVILDWQNMGSLITYRLYRSYNGCEGPWLELADDLYTTEYYDTPISTEGLAYQLEAIAPSGMCYSLPSNCVADFQFERLYLPLLVSNIPACDVGCAIMQILPQ
jgi:Zn-dependent M28 family amino/carboxypeptidase